MGIVYDGGMTILLIIRHGNTFGPEEEPRRVGCRTDIPLVQSGVEQARALGCYLKRENLLPDHIYASELQRAQQTAQIMAHDAQLHINIRTDKCFNEIDHGPDENKTETEILERLGSQALKEWNEYGVVPKGWKVDPRQLQKSWVNFADECVQNRNGKITCVVSSGGVIRFAPILLDDNRLPDGETPKVKTASMSLFRHNGQGWVCEFWNKRPQ